VRTDGVTEAKDDAEGGHVPVQIPLKLKYRTRSGGGRKGKGAGRSGTAKSRLPKFKGETEAAQEITRANQRILVLENGRHRRLERQHASQTGDASQR
jgi:hypothetical protein